MCVPRLDESYQGVLLECTPSCQVRDSGIGSLLMYAACGLVDPEQLKSLLEM